MQKQLFLTPWHEIMSEYQFSIFQSTVVCNSNVIAVDNVLCILSPSVRYKILTTYTVNFNPNHISKNHFLQEKQTNKPTQPKFSIVHPTCLLHCIFRWHTSVLILWERYYLTFISSERGNVTATLDSSILRGVKLVWRTSLAFQGWNRCNADCIVLSSNLSNLEKKVSSSLLNGSSLQSKTSTQIPELLNHHSPATAFASGQQGILQTHVSHPDN